MRILDPGPLISLAQLQVECARIPLESIPEGSGTARGEGTKEGWISGLRMTRLSLDSLNQYPRITELVLHHAMRIGQQITQVMVNELAGGCKLDKHRDGLPEMDRWHFPVFTNDLVEWWDEHEGQLHMQAGKWHGPVNYCGILHSMRNDGASDRLHLVVDFEPLVAPRR